MSDNGKCVCPLCGENFIFDDEITADEHLARGVLALMKDWQENEEYDMSRCLRCGQRRMLSKIVRNAMSRHTDLYICPACGTDEAVRVYSDSVMPVTDWWIVKEILAYKKA
jgi:predicted RNA-binding Zn-ribbon protein involved in translation (DUF1610 family)